MLIRGFTVLRDGTNVCVHIRYFERDAVDAVFCVAGSAACLRRIYTRLDYSRAYSSLHFDFMVKLAVELVADSFQGIDQTGFVLDHNVVPALAVEAAANRTYVG